MLSTVRMVKLKANEDNCERVGVCPADRTICPDVRGHC